MTTVKARGAGRPGRFARRHATLAYVLIATASTVVVFGVAAAVIVSSPGWPTVKASFFDWSEVTTWFRPVLDAFWLNVKIFTVCEIAVLICALGIAVLRSLPGAVFFPLRALAIVYADLFRGIPTILVIYLLGFGVPALQLSGVPNDPLFWGGVALILVYTAYVAEVYRAGIESVHPSQEAAARSLGLTRGQSLRFVVLPQAVRRVVPPLLNDFIGLQKDTALVGLLGPIEAFNQSNIAAQSDFNFTPYLIAAALFVAITIPLARFTDWLVARERRSRQVSRAA
jgi:polar amino acid transport system permease protein